MPSPAVAFGLVLAVCLPAAEIVQRERLDVGRAWAGHPLDFALVTKGSHQFVAWYDTARRLTVSHRQLPATTWTRTNLPTTVGWDSHNGIALGNGQFIHARSSSFGTTISWLDDPFWVAHFAGARRP